MSSIKIIYVALLCVVSASFAHAGLTATQCRDGGNEQDMYNAVDTTIAACRNEVSKCGGDSFQILVTILILESIKLTLYVVLRQMTLILLKINILGIIVISLKLTLCVKLINFLLVLVVDLVLIILDLLLGKIDILKFNDEIDIWYNKYSTSVGSQCDNDADFKDIIDIIVAILIYWTSCCKACLCH